MRSAHLSDFDLSLPDIYEHAPCGYAILRPDGTVASANATLATWLGVPADDVVGRSFRDRLSVPGRILYETHVVPALRMQGFVTEIAMDLLTADGGRLPVFISGNERRDERDELIYTRLIVFQAAERRGFERSLIESREQAFKGLADEKALGALREQFIAVLGHDLRNPLASIDAGLRMISKEPVTAKQARLIGLMQASSLRMSGLIDNVLDFARGQLGGGLMLTRNARTDLEPMLRLVIAELQEVHPDVEIDAVFAIPRPVDCDQSRIGQMLSNLLGNALTHGAADQPVRVDAVADDERLRISVANAGKPIPPAAMEQLFQPFFRGNVRDSANGLGLGLHIASMIAQAHGGSLTVVSSEVETRFTFEMPVSAADRER